MLRYTNWVGEGHPDFICDVIIDKFTDIIEKNNHSNKFSLEIDAMLLGEDIIIWGLSTTPISQDDKDELYSFVMDKYRHANYRLQIKIKYVTSILKLPEAEVDFSIRQSSFYTNPFDYDLAHFIWYRLGDAIGDRVDIQVVIDDKLFERSQVVERVIVNVFTNPYHHLKGTVLGVLRHFASRTKVDFKVKDIIINDILEENQNEYDFDMKIEKEKIETEERQKTEEEEKFASLSRYERYLLREKKKALDRENQTSQVVKEIEAKAEKYKYQIDELTRKKYVYKERYEAFGRSNNKLHQDYYGNLRIVGPKAHGRVYDSKRIKLTYNDLSDELIHQEELDSILNIRFPRRGKAHLHNTINKKHLGKLPRNDIIASDLREREDDSLWELINFIASEPRERAVNERFVSFEKKVHELQAQAKETSHKKTAEEEIIELINNLEEAKNSKNSLEDAPMEDDNASNEDNNFDWDLSKL
jgi:hypothetical protein